MNPILIIPILTGFSVILIGLSALLSRWNRQAPLRARLEDLAGAPSSHTRQSGARQSPGLADVVASVGTTISSGKVSRTLREQLTQAGHHHPDAAAIYIGIKILLLIAGLMGGGALVIPTSIANRNKFIFCAAAGFIPFLIPNAIVSSHRRRRRRIVRRNLPDAVDLLEICTSAGMGLDQAWNAVSDRIREVNTILADEMALTNLENHLGATRVDAMRHMAERTGAHELSSLVAVLVQSERFGTSIGEALQEFARFMRESRSQNAQESAEKMAVKLIFPMVIFIFPAVVLIMAGPAFITLYHVLKPQ